MKYFYFHVSDINYVARTYSDNLILMGDPSWNGRKDVNIYSETGNSPWNINIGPLKTETDEVAGFPPPGDPPF